MNSNMILKTDILDIIFEKRNKAYGAYVLRKYYPGRIKTALLFMLAGAAAFSAFILFPQRTNVVISRPYVFEEIILTKTAVTAIEPEKKQEMVSPEKKITPANRQKFLSNPKIVADHVKSDTIQTLKAGALISNVNIPVADSVVVAVQPVKTAAGTGITFPAPKTGSTLPMDINAVDVQPSFPGGMDALKKFLERNLQNPYDLENGETVNVKIRFVVGYDGKLQSFATLQDGGETYNKEVVRVLKKMPDWEPGKANGENVSVYYTIPVKFVMSD